MNTTVWVLDEQRVACFPPQMDLPTQESRI